MAAVTSVNERDDVIYLERGLKIVKSLNFNAQVPVQSVIHSGDYLTVCHNNGSGENYLLRYPLISGGSQVNAKRSRYNMPVPINKLLYVNDIMIYIAFCNDFRLRVYNQEYELLTTLALSFNVTCMCFDENCHVLYAGGMGHLSSWTVQLEGYNVLLPNPPINFSILDRQQIISLSMCYRSPLLCITCIHGIYLLNTETQKEQHFISNANNSPLICAIVYGPLNYIIAARQDGTIKVSSYIKKKEKSLYRETTSAITALLIHPDLPFLISACLHGTIRIWNLLTLTETLLHEVKSNIPSVSLTSSRQLLCSSISNIFLFNLNMVVELLSVMHSEVTSLKVNEYCNLQRIVALTKNGCVRVVLPHSGKFRTVLLPILSTRLLETVLYNMPEEVLYLLLKTGEILIYDTKTKPCTPLEMWAPSNRQQETSCIDIVQTPVGPIIFAGLRSGFLCILHAKDCLIALPCPAHDEAIFALAGSMSSCLYRKNPAVNVVTYASNGLYHVWIVEIKTDVNNRLLIHDNITLSLNISPAYMKLLDTKLCITTSTNNILMYDIPMEESMATLALASPRPLNKNAKHFDVITSLACSSSLRLFATSSNDGRIKIWNNKCILVSEINLGSIITCIAFNDVTHDLLIGFQNQLFVLSALHYLPSYIHESHQGSDTMIEYPLRFQPKLKFWFDQSVPVLPLLPHARNNTVDFIPTPNPFTLKLLSQPPPHMKSLETQIRQQQNIQGVRQTEGAQPVPQQLSLHELLNSASFMNKTSSSGSINPNYSDTILALSHRRNSNIPLGINQQMRGNLNHQKLHGATIAPLNNPSSSMPVAPDGFIPNSVVRAKVAENQPVDHVLQRVLVRQYKALELQRNVTAKKKRIRKVLMELKFFTDKEMDQLDARQPQEEDEGETEEKEDTTKSDEEKTERPTFEIPQWFPNNSYDQERKRVRTLIKTSKYKTPKEMPEPLPSLPTYTFKIDGGVGEGKQEGDESRDQSKGSNRTNNNEHDPSTLDDYFKTHLTPEALTFPDDDDDVHYRPLSYNTKRIVKLKLGYKPKTPETTKSQTLADFTTNNSIERTQSDYTYGRKERDKINRYLTNPIIGCSANKGKAKDDQTTEYSTNIKPQKQDGDELMSTINCIIEKPWFPWASIPQNTDDSEETLDWVIDMLVHTMDGVELSTFTDITEAFVMLHAKNYMTEDQKKTTVKKLLGRYLDNLEDKESDNILELISKLDTKYNEETIMTILPTLVDQNDELKQAGFKALKKLTGVTTTSGLHKLLLDKKLLKHVNMNEDAIMDDLETRLESAPQLPNVYHTKRASSGGKGSGDQRGSQTGNEGYGSGIGINVLPFRNQQTMMTNNTTNDKTTPFQGDMILESIDRPMIATPTSQQQKTPPNSFPRLSARMKRTTPSGRMGSVTPSTDREMSLTSPMSHKTPPTNYRQYKTLPTRSNTPMSQVMRAVTNPNDHLIDIMSDDTILDSDHMISDTDHMISDHVTKAKAKTKGGYMDYMYFPSKAKTSGNVTMETGDSTLMISGDSQKTSRQIKPHHMTSGYHTNLRERGDINGQTQTRQVAPPHHNHMTSMRGHMIHHVTGQGNRPQEYTIPGHAMTGYPVYMTSDNYPPTDHMTYMTDNSDERDNDIFYSPDHMTTPSSDHMTSATSHMTKRRRYTDYDISLSSSQLFDKSQATPSFPSTLIPEHLPQIKFHNTRLLKQKILEQATPHFSQSLAAREYIMRWYKYNQQKKMTAGEHENTTHLLRQHDNDHHKSLNNTLYHDSNSVRQTKINQQLFLSQSRDLESPEYYKLLKSEILHSDNDDYENLHEIIPKERTLRRRRKIHRRHSFDKVSDYEPESPLGYSSSHVFSSNKVLKSKTQLPKVFCSSPVDNTLLQSQVMFAWSDVKPLLLIDTQYGAGTIATNLLPSTPPTFKLPKVI